MIFHEVQDYSAADQDALVRMWRESFEYGVQIKDPHPLEAQVAYFEREIRPNNQVLVVKDSGQILAFLASNTDSVAQLHVRVGHHRRGIGSHLLSLAKIRSGGRLWLFTFARNVSACAFYESQGFSIVQRGFEPDWQLEDVKYAWSRVESAA